MQGCIKSFEGRWRKRFNDWVLLKWPGYLFVTIIWKLPFQFYQELLCSLYAVYLYAELVSLKFYLKRDHILLFFRLV